MPEASHTDFAPVLSAFSPVSLEEMDSVKLMNRIDTKYVCTEAKDRCTIAKWTTFI